MHPLGLALSVKLNGDGTESLDSILDNRDDEEGFIYDLKNSDNDRIERFLYNENYINQEFEKRKNKRIELFNDVVEPIMN